jgi:hypothetical protein
LINSSDTDTKCKKSERIKKETEEFKNTLKGGKNEEPYNFEETFKKAINNN